MKIDNQDIIRAARQLRDEENEQLNVRPSAPSSQRPTVGCPVAEDHIRYDLLVRN